MNGTARTVTSMDPGIEKQRDFYLARAAIRRAAAQWEEHLASVAYIQDPHLAMMVGYQAEAVEFDDLAEAVAQVPPGELRTWLELVKAGLTGWEALRALDIAAGRGSGNF